MSAAAAATHNLATQKRHQMNQNITPASDPANSTHDDYFAQHQVLRQRVSASVKLPDLEFAGMAAGDLGEAADWLDRFAKLAEDAAVERRDDEIPRRGDGGFQGHEAALTEDGKEGR